MEYLEFEWSKQYHAGWDAYEDGKSRNACPHTEEKAIFWWQWGWDTAKELDEEIN